VQGLLSAISEYGKNEFSELPTSIREQVADQWHRCFSEWTYDR
jgi:hypothetical protein